MAGNPDENDEWILIDHHWTIIIYHLSIHILLSSFECITGQHPAEWHSGWDLWWLLVPPDVANSGYAKEAPVDVGGNSFKGLLYCWDLLGKCNHRILEHPLTSKSITVQTSCDSHAAQIDGCHWGKLERCRAVQDLMCSWRSWTVPSGWAETSTSTSTRECGKWAQGCNRWFWWIL